MCLVSPGLSNCSACSDWLGCCWSRPRGWPCEAWKRDPTLKSGRGGRQCLAGSPGDTDNSSARRNRRRWQWDWRSLGGTAARVFAAGGQSSCSWTWTWPPARLVRHSRLSSVCSCRTSLASSAWALLACCQWEDRIPSGPSMQPFPCQAEPHRSLTEPWCRQVHGFAWSSQCLRSRGQSRQGNWTRNHRLWRS